MIASFSLFFPRSDFWWTLLHESMLYVCCCLRGKSCVLHDFDNSYDFSHVTFGTHSCLMKVLFWFIHATKLVYTASFIFSCPGWLQGEMDVVLDYTPLEHIISVLLKFGCPLNCLWSCYDRRWTCFQNPSLYMGWDAPCGHFHIAGSILFLSLKTWCPLLS